MTVGIVGLGLIGGSFAKAYHEAGATVLAWNRSRSVLDFAIMSGAVDAELTEDNIAACDLVLIALYPEATIEWFRRMAPHIGAHPVVLDCGGHEAHHLRRVLPDRKGTRRHVPRRPPDGRHAVFRLQEREGDHVPRRADGHRAAGL